ncbi:MAG: toll/interleukin-1 receptor domain-containing protein, partial [Desulfobacteraceae bacterium]|nr:toll/interleukin-1 receptor domain-containing protein [Desulfobacteraceae bacterium]
KVKETEKKKEKHIYIGYAKEDEEATMKLYHNLQKSGINVWLDTINISPGEHWKMSVYKAISQSKYFIAILSENSISKKGYFQKELKTAIEISEKYPPTDIFIIPVRLEECEPLHKEISDIYQVDMFPSWENGVERIIETIKTNS